VRDISYNNNVYTHIYSSGGQIYFIGIIQYIIIGLYSREIIYLCIRYIAQGVTGITDKICNQPTVYNATFVPIDSC